MKNILSLGFTSLIIALVSLFVTPTTFAWSTFHGETRRVTIDSFSQDQSTGDITVHFSNWVNDTTDWSGGCFLYVAADSDDERLVAQLGNSCSDSIQVFPSAPILGNGTYWIQINDGRGFGWASDNSFTIGSVSNSAPTVGAITASTNSIQVNTSTTASASFTDADGSDTHTATWNWGDGNTTTGTVTETGGSGSVSNSHTYTAAGVYKITLTVTDNHDQQANATYEYLAVYAPTNNARFNGTRIYSNPGTASPSTSGQVKFGIITKYDNNNQPTGSVKMDFKDADLSFVATSFDYLVTSGTKAWVKGSGTLNGTSGYTFLASGDDNGDLIRFQIKQGTTVIYDSQPSAADNADPTTSVSAGNINIQ